MDDTKKMLQAIINGQSSLKQELLSKIDKVDKKLSDRIDGIDQKVDGLSQKVDKVEKNLIKRMDKLGNQLAYLEDDAPTREEFDDLEKRVGNVEQKSASPL